MCKNNDSFNAICEQFCCLAKTLDDGGYRDISRVVDGLMVVWLNTALVK